MEIINKHSKKICFVSSSGGHYEQLMMLKPLIEKYDSFIITEKTLYDDRLTREKKYLVPQINRREAFFLINLIINVIKSTYIFFKEKPDIVISTGALSTIPICIISKIFKKKIIFIESFAKIKTPTLTGKFLYRFVDQFYVQWEDMLQVYPLAIYKGGIY